MHYVVSAVKKFVPTRLRLAMRKFISCNNDPSDEQVAVPQKTLKEMFSEVYEKNIFKGRSSRSGEGSDLVQTEVIRADLPKLLKELNVHVFLDAPCGDWYWMRKVTLGVDQYIGVDIVEDLIKKNTQQFGDSACTFLCRNLAEDHLPEADLILCRDCLVHLNFADIHKVIANFKRSRSKYLLTTTFTHRDTNHDLARNNGFWQPLNLLLPPFNFPTPLKLINENCTEWNNQYTDKCLGLWRLEDIKIV